MKKSKPKPWTVEQLEELGALLSQGFKQCEIAKIMKRSRHSIYYGSLHYCNKWVSKNPPSEIWYLSK